MIRRGLVLLVLASMLCFSACGSLIKVTVTDGKPTDEDTREYQPAEVSAEKLGYLNFITELPLGHGTDFSYENFAHLQTDQELFPLEEGDSNTCAFAFDRERYAYIGCNTFPARIVKYDMLEMKRISHLVLPANDNRDECRVAALIAIDSETIIHASFNDPCVFTKIDGNTMEITGTLSGEDDELNDQHIRGLTYDGKYIYAGSYSIPGKIIKIDPVTMTKVDEAVLMDVTDVFALTVCGNYLVGVGCRDKDKDSKFFRIDLNDFQEDPDTLYVKGFSSYQSICTDGTSVYAGTATNPISVVKVDVLGKKLAFAGSFTGKKDDEFGNFSIVYTGTDVIVGTWALDKQNTLDKLIKLDPADMSRKDTLVTPIKFPADLMYLDPYLYTCCDKPTGVVMRLKF